MVKLDFFGGVDEIGGNKVLLAEGTDSFFLDFGMSFKRANQFFSEFLQPRAGNGILDFLELGLLPDVKGIYREDYLKHSGLTSFNEPSVDGVLVSHAHMDHSAYIHHLREDIPVYLTMESYLIMKSIQETTSTSFNELVTLKKNFFLRPKKRVREGSSPYTKVKDKEAEIEREIKIIKPYESFDFGEVSVRCAPVDHSLPGACAFLVESGDEAIVYTGDLRFHGRNSEMTEKFVKEASKFEPTKMLCEGTRMDTDYNISEESVERKSTEIIDGYRDHVIVNYPIRDLDRFLTFYKVAENTGRTMVVNLKEAYILNQFNAEGFNFPQDFAIYVPRRSWGLVGDEACACLDGEWVSCSDLHPQHTEDGFKNWEKDFITLEKAVNYRDIRESPEEYIFSCDFFELKELIDVKPDKGLYIWSKTEPFNDEMQIDFRKAKNWISHFNLELVTEGMHGSGHANRNEILKMVREINPEIIYPMHTEKKDEFAVLIKDDIKVSYPDLS
ncbi:RNA-metabolising metallo-beta-lactamase [Methanobacterium sp. MB1]|nr:RNA-metabolising metallo-beta-lactamase [Methanobacterium sp. MB1]